MTFYHQYVLETREQLYSKGYLLQQVINARVFIDTNFAEKIELNDIAQQAFFSKFHFIRLFKTVYGQTPHQHLKMRRIEKAKQLLQSGMPVAHVCFSVGFESVSSFTALFKKTTGSTPSAFQKGKKERYASAAICKIIAGWKSQF